MIFFVGFFTDGRSVLCQKDLRKYFTYQLRYLVLERFRCQS